MPKIAFRTAWLRNDEQCIADAKAFWSAPGFLEAEERERRVGELCGLAYCDGRVVGVSTIRLGPLTPLRARFAFFRCAVAEDFRRRYLATFLTRHAITTMEAWSLDNPQEKILGVAMILEAWELGSKAVYPQWADYNGHVNLVGFTPRGDQVRVAWFRHAEMDSPSGNSPP